MSAEPMSRWQVVLSSASRALQGRVVSVWESDDGGELHWVAASGFEESLLSAPEELSRALRQWQGRVARRRKWVASRSDKGQWCVAPVKVRPPRPRPGTGDRRGPERAVLGLAGACLGMIERQGSVGRVPPSVERTLQRTLHELEDTAVTAVALESPGPEVAGEAHELAQFRAMVESAHDAILGTTLDGIVTYWNPSAERLYGYPADEVLGQSVALLIPFERPNELPDILERIRRGERVEHYETIRVRKGGQRIHVSVTVSPILDADGHPIGASAIARDASDRVVVEAELRRSAMQDALTELPNRVLFNERVASALERLRRDLTYRFAVLFLDFDDFKVVNDSLGHSVGDRLLQGIAERLRESVRPGDIVARLGGDEFTLLLENVATAGEAEFAAQRIQRCFASAFDLGDRQIVISASIGVALGDASYARPEDILRDADIAMYRAKGQGHARFQVFDVTMRNWAHARFGMTTDLRGALDRNELELAFQPVVELSTGKVRTMEALLRWNHPRRGVIEPGEFIPLAEQTGLIVPIGAWVLAEACARARRWQKEVPGASGVGVSVNISAKQLGQSRIVDDVRQALERTGLDPASLQLEITESVLLGNGESATARLEELSRLNLELQVDDFGTGYSWLSYLPRFPLRTIKIDRSFVNRMGARRTDVEIVRSIVDLATTLGLGVIAEGVETQAQRRRLMAFGCELGQGFLFAKPMKGDEVDGLFAALPLPIGEPAPTW